MRRRFRPSRVDLATAILFVALVVFGARFHWVEEAGTAERDGFVAQAEMLAGGELPGDPFRPLLYQLLVAALAPFVGGAFPAARLISNLAAVYLARSAYSLGSRLAADGGRPGPVAESARAEVGGWAMALVVVNPNLWILGQHATTDMLFAALAAGLAVVALKHLDHSRRSSAVLLGVLLGLAAFTRGNALFLAPMALLALWFGSKSPQKPWRYLLTTATVALITLVPHFVLRWFEFGSPFYDENWKNLAFKLFGEGDWSYLDRVPFDGAAAIFVAEPFAVLRGGASEIRRFLQGGLSQLVGTPLHAALFVVAAIAALVRRSRSAALLVVGGAVFVAALAFAFFTWGRFLLFLVPLAAAVTAAEAMSWGDHFEARHPIRVAVRLGLAALVVLLAAKTALFRLPAFVERHPVNEVEALVQLEGSIANAQAADSVVAGTSPFLGRYVALTYLDLPDAFGAQVRNDPLYFAALRHFVDQHEVRYLVVGEVDLRSRPAALLDSVSPVDWLVPVTDRQREDEVGVAVWRVVE